MRDIGKNIKAIRIRKNMTQDELAQALFVTRQTVSNYETGRSRPDVDMLLRIAEALGVDANTVLYGLPIPEEKKRSCWSLGISLGLTVIIGILVLWLRSAGREQEYIYIMTPSILVVAWLLPAWLLLVGWTAMHALCLTLGTRTLAAPVSKYIKWGILGFIAAYVILITPHTLWYVWCDWQLWQQQQADGSVSFSSFFSVFPAWDWLVLHIANLSRPRTVIQTVFAVLDYLPLPLGALLRLCGFPGKTKKKAKLEFIAQPPGDHAGALINRHIRKR